MNGRNPRGSNSDYGQSGYAICMVEIITDMKICQIDLTDSNTVPTKRQKKNCKNKKW